jgi:hypothetical protein
MPRFRSTNVIVNFDEAVVRAEDPVTKQPVYTANPDAARDHWQSDTLNVLESLYVGSRVSRLLFDAIQEAGTEPASGKYVRYLVIRPYTPADEKKDLCNAYAGPDDYGMAATPAPIDGVPARGAKGVGSTTVIRYDKARWVTATKCGGLAGQPGGVFHEILLHEMLHGLRQMAGQQDRSALPNGWTTMEEFYAILITNVSMSERGYRQYRKNHRGFGVLEPSLSTSVGFLTNPDHLKWVDWLFNTNAVFFRKVAEVVAPFNPIREYVTNRAAWRVVLTNPPTTK